MKKFFKKVYRHSVERAARYAMTALGEIQRSTGRPIRFVGTHRQALEQCLQALRPAPEIKGRVLLTALRNRSWIGVGVYAACVLRQLGYETTLLYRASDIKRLFPARHPRFGFWPGVRQIPGIELIDLDAVDVSPDESEEFRPCACKAAPSALAYDHHVEEQDILAGDARVQADLEAMIEMMVRMGAATKKLLAQRRYHRFILYSGLIGESPTMLDAALRCGVHTVCIEGWGWRAGHLLCNHNSPALEYDIDRWLKKIQPWTDAMEQEIDRYLAFLEGRYTGGSSWLDNLYFVQRAKVSNQLPTRVREFVAGGHRVFLAGANVIGDSSMLNRETIFAGQQDWCRHLIEYFKARPHLKLIFRAHPGEIWFGDKLLIKMEDVARRYAGDAPNILIVGATEKLNTFSLVGVVHATLVWHSNIGVDMVVRGVPAMAAARPKYTGLGIVVEPATRDEYFAILDAWAVASPVITPEQKRMAKQYLYIVFKGFSFEAWSRNSFLTGCRLNRMPNQAEHDVFYRELISDGN